MNELLEIIEELKNKLISACDGNIDNNIAMCNSQSFCQYRWRNYGKDTIEKLEKWMNNNKIHELDNVLPDNIVCYYIEKTDITGSQSDNEIIEPSIETITVCLIDG